MTVVNTVEDADLLARHLADPTLTTAEALRMYRADLKRRKRKKVPLPPDEATQSESEKSSRAVPA